MYDQVFIELNLLIFVRLMKAIHGGLTVVDDDVSEGQFRSGNNF